MTTPGADIGSRERMTPDERAHLRRFTHTTRVIVVSRHLRRSREHDDAWCRHRQPGSV